MLLVVIAFAAPAVLDRVVITAPANGSVLPLTGPTPVTVMWTVISGAAQYGLEFTGADRVFANPNGTGADGVNGFGGRAARWRCRTRASPSCWSRRSRVVGLTAGFQPVGGFCDAVTLSLGAVPPEKGGSASRSRRPRAC